MTLFFSLLKAFLNRETFSSYFSQVDLPFLKENHPELYRLFSCLPELHSGDTHQFSVADLELCFYRLYPNSNSADYTPFFNTLSNTQVDEQQVKQYLRSLVTRAQATKIAQQALLVAEGVQADTDKLFQAINELAVDAEVVEQESDFAEDDWEVLLREQQAEPGLKWRLNSLNKNLGPLSKGIFGFLFARPETGKTTFLASELSYMAGQIPPNAGPILWFNNEEKNRTVIKRCYTAALGLPTHILETKDPKWIKEEYFRATGGKLKVIKDDNITKRRVEELCVIYQPSLIVYDQIDYIKGFDADRDDLELEAIYQWARELAKRYAPSIGVCQAGASGEGKRWLTMNDVINSKTGKQGAADWILGIGKVYDEDQEFTRFLHLSKNKLPTTAESDEAMRHGKWEVRIRPDIARYEDY